MFTVGLNVALAIMNFGCFLLNVHRDVYGIALFTLCVCGYCSFVAAYKFTDLVTRR